MAHLIPNHFTAVVYKAALCIWYLPWRLHSVSWEKFDVHSFLWVLKSSYISEHHSSFFSIMDYHHLLPCHWGWSHCILTQFSSLVILKHPQSLFWKFQRKGKCWLLVQFQLWTKFLKLAFTRHYFWVAVFHFLGLPSNRGSSDLLWVFQHLRSRSRRIAIQRVTYPSVL